MIFPPFWVVSTFFGRTSVSFLWKWGELHVFKLYCSFITVLVFKWYCSLTPVILVLLRVFNGQQKRDSKDKIPIGLNSSKRVVLSKMSTLCFTVKGRLTLRNLKGGILSLFDPCVNAMGQRPYWPSRMEVSYCTFRFGANILRNLRTLSSPRDSTRDNH